ncbi:LnmK family bifunctional acyltransferase/decarboxylase [Streptomyces sp. NPDC058451]|uniref:LnmK family bifunctional acyltransferase/decarboxylase n=1 Tax=Streptomyces sp. NPDC058451 TaxID=3346506 RepID=UPI003648D0FC
MPGTEDSLLRPEVWRAPDGSVGRLVTVKPGMCGHNSLFIGQVGDWTWETVSEVCGTDAFNAVNDRGRPTYLSFYYFRVRSGGQLHSGALTFGDRIETTSRVFGYGSESVLTLHRIRRVPPGSKAKPEQGLDPDEFFAARQPDCLYVQNFNRWVTRSHAGSNEGLITSAPADFRHAHLPHLPAAYSPRAAYGSARVRQTFHDPQDPEWEELVAADEVEYPIDITRDINGVGLLYFASYFSIIDGALLKMWRNQGRADRRFLDRTVLDHQLCYLGNADADSVLRIRLRSWRRRDDPAEERWNAVVEDAASGRCLAVCTLHVRLEGSNAAAQ